MEIRDLLSKPVWQMTGEEFIFLNRHALQGSGTKPAQPAADKDKKYVYGIGGIARLFGCSIPTANRIKKSGRIDRAITQIGRCGMDNKERNITPEEAVILWQASRLDLSEDYEKAPEILKVRGSVIGTLGNFSASIGKAKSKKTFNVSAIVAAALKNGTVLSYTAELPENKRKILYVDTEQSIGKTFFGNFVIYDITGVQNLPQALSVSLPNKSPVREQHNHKFSSHRVLLPDHPHDKWLHV